MAKHAIYTNEDGGVSVMTPAEDAMRELTLKEITTLPAYVTEMLAREYSEEEIASLVQRKVTPHIPMTAEEIFAKDVPNEQLAKSDGLAEVIGALVITYEAGGLPAGLAIGRVIKRKPSPRNMLFSDLTIEPFIRTARLSRVMVLRPVRPGN